MRQQACIFLLSLLVIGCVVIVSIVSAPGFVYVQLPARLAVVARGFSFQRRAATSSTTSTTSTTSSGTTSTTSTSTTNSGSVVLGRGELEELFQQHCKWNGLNMKHLDYPTNARAWAQGKYHPGVNRVCPPPYFKSKAWQDYAPHIMEEGGSFMQWSALANFTASDCQQQIFNFDMKSPEMNLSVLSLVVSSIGIRLKFEEKKQLASLRLGGTAYEAQLWSRSQLAPCRVADHLDGTYTVSCEPVCPSRCEQGTCTAWWTQSGSWKLNLFLEFASWVQYFGHEPTKQHAFGPSREPVHWQVMPNCPFLAWPKLLAKLEALPPVEESRRCLEKPPRCSASDLTASGAGGWVTMTREDAELVTAAVKRAEPGSPDRVDLGWRSANCTTGPVTTAQLNQCMAARKHIAFLGDSHLRYTFDVLSSEWGQRVQLDAHHPFHHYGFPGTRQLAFYDAYVISGDLIPGHFWKNWTHPERGGQKLENGESGKTGMARLEHMVDDLKRKDNACREYSQDGPLTSCSVIDNFNKKTTSWARVNNTISKPTGDLAVMVVGLGSWDAAYYGVEATLLHTAKLLDRVAEIVKSGVVPMLTVLVVSLPAMPLGTGESYTMRGGARNNFMTSVVQEYVKFRITDYNLPNLHFYNLFGSLRMRPDDTCVANNVHYLCAFQERIVGDAGYSALYAAVLSTICDSSARA